MGILARRSVVGQECPTYVVRSDIVLRFRLLQAHGLQRAAAGDKRVSLAIVFELHADCGSA